MDARTIRKLLRCIQATEDRFTVTEALKSFMAEYPAIGRVQGSSWYLTPADKGVITKMLAAEGVAAGTSPDAWTGKTRAESLELGKNEKMSSAPVKRRRVAVKALRPTAPVMLGGAPIFMPARCDIGIDTGGVDVSGHDWIVVVENWESFADIHLAADRLDFPGMAPLVVFRGDASDLRADAMLSWLADIAKPIAAFVDYDPAGLVIANSLPRLDAFVAPKLDELRSMMKDNGLQDRFLAQLPGCQRILDERAHPLLRPVWAVIRETGKAYPQEHFSREALP